MPLDPRRPTGPEPTTELVVLAGLTPDGTEQIAQLMLAEPGTVVVHHDLRHLGDGRVFRRIRDATSDTATEVELAHGCLSCTLRDDLLPRVVELTGQARRVVVHLDPVLEPEQVCFALAHLLLGDEPAATTVTDVVDLLGVITVIDVATWFDDATGEETVAERGLVELFDDERTIAQLATAQVEFADLIVRCGTAPARELARTNAVLARLSPTAGQVRLADAALDPAVLSLAVVAPEARRGRPDGVHAPLLRGAPPLDSDCGVSLFAFSDRRPFHPQRLHDAVDLLLDGVVRSRGRVWLATRPAEVLWLESAGGGLRLGRAGHWLADAGEEAWEHATPERAAMASLGWDEHYGDRSQDITVLTYAADHAEMSAALHAALLTDDELAAGERAWAQLPDPFGSWQEHGTGDADGCRHERDDQAGAAGRARAEAGAREPTGAGVAGPAPPEAAR
ncbi:cobalamin synthesis CobW domain protein [Pseudonocardia dioxanivorans CB1190]|uniref:Cobalamin synthesis CobW domain protein n=1 Tax=Pseudonocardia dioxanivorans (strain ATCC 55486 / DSM 44775 / JCM 13855 / CB1190) TaxID=675635 RepID=F4CMQ2_PSEUX|nr:GTP-binding protein [Pseudonocardia dioxanivorans]AEA24419.1 cobalamin synthesis CobW domain protein [Pseudonocardia dioxanivorans CB1190]